MRGWSGKGNKEIQFQNIFLRKHLHSDKNLELTELGRKRWVDKEIGGLRKREEHMQKP